MAKAPVFWVMYLMFTLVAAGGLMATAQLGSIAKDFPDRRRAGEPGGHHHAGADLRAVHRPRAQRPHRPFFAGCPTTSAAENTMFIAFGLEAVGVLALAHFGSTRWRSCC